MKRTNKTLSKSAVSGVSSPSLSAGNMLAELAEVGAVMNEMFAELESETGSFISRMISGFHDISGIFEDIMKMILSAAGGGAGESGPFGSLLGLLPGGNILGGIIDLFTGLGSSMHLSGSGNDLNYANESMLQMPNISVIVQSEVEQVKAVKFLTNYMPVYNTRTSGSAL